MNSTPTKNRHWARWVIGAVVAIVILVVAVPFVYFQFIQGDPPPKLSLSTTTTPTSPPGETGASAPLDDKTMLIAAQPAAQVHEDMDPQQTDARSATAVVEHAGGWCVSASSSGGDESGSTLCFRADVGLLGGAAYFAGGSTIDTTWGDVPKPQ